MPEKFTDLYGFTIPDFFISLYFAVSVAQMKIGCDLSSELFLWLLYLQIKVRGFTHKVRIISSPKQDDKIAFLQLLIRSLTPNSKSDLFFYGFSFPPYI